MFEKLPIELFRLEAFYLFPKDCLNLMMVNKYFYSVFNDEEIWHNHLNALTHSSWSEEDISTSKMSWKQIYYFVLLLYKKQWTALSLAFIGVSLPESPHDNFSTNVSNNIDTQHLFLILDSLNNNDLNFVYLIKEKIQGVISSIQDTILKTFCAKINISFFSIFRHFFESNSFMLDNISIIINNLLKEKEYQQCLLYPAQVLVALDQTEAVEMHVKKKEGVDEIFGNSKTLLYIAALYNNFNTVKMLIRLGADKNIVCDGDTAFTIAAIHGNYKLLDLLWPDEFNPNEKDYLIDSITNDDINYKKLYEIEISYMRRVTMNPSFFKPNYFNMIQKHDEFLDEETLKMKMVFDFLFRKGIAPSDPEFYTHCGCNDKEEFIQAQRLYSEWVDFNKSQCDEFNICEESMYTKQKLK